MDINSILNDGPPATERRPSSRQMSISQRADSISSTTPTMSTQSPRINGHNTSTSTPTSLERPRSSDDRTMKPFPEKPIEILTTHIGKRKRENGEQAPKKKRISEPPLWARKIPERVNSGLSWHMLPKAPPFGSRPAHRDNHTEPASAPSIPAPQSQPGPNIISPLNPFGSTYCNTTPGDELTRNVADFLYVQIGPLLQSLPSANIEIEAKLGRIINRDTDERVILPVQTEAVMTPNPNGIRTIFQSSMTEEEHMHFNQQLNANTTAQTPNPSGKTHERILHIDSFWQLSRADAITHIPAAHHALILGGGSAPIKVRLSHAWNEHTRSRGAEKACIIKRRLHNLDIYNPRWPFDWRISVNIEYTYTGPRSALEPALEANGTRARDRAKNRLRYFYPVCDIDFTKVTTVPAGEFPGSASWEEHEHELEVELQSARVYEQLDLLSRDPRVSRYEDLVRVLVDNVRVLTRSGGNR